MDSRDIPLLEQADPSFAEMPFQELTDGMTFDLGGTVLEAIAVPGHTPGSFVFLDRQGKRLYSGDAVGSGEFWMQLPESLPLEEFLTAAEGLADRIKDCDPKICPGHRYQSPVQLDGRYLSDVIELTKDILAGKNNEAPVKTMDLGFGEIRFKEASKGLITNYVYDPENVRR